MLYMFTCLEYLNVSPMKLSKKKCNINYHMKIQPHDISIRLIVISHRSNIVDMSIPF